MKSLLSNTTGRNGFHPFILETSLSDSDMEFQEQISQINRKKC